MGVTCLRTVPGGTVLRTTTEWWPDAGGCTQSIAARMSVAARMRWARLVAPLPVDGVPTHSSERSAPSSARSTLVVARRRPSCTPCASSSATPASTTGLSPRPTLATRVGSMSTPMTS